MIMNDTAKFSEKYIHQFVFAEWNLKKERLLVYSEYKKVRTLIKK